MEKVMKIYKSMKVPFIETFLEKMNTCHNNPKASSATKINKQPLIIHCLHTVHLIQQKISLIIIEAKIV